MAGIQIPVELLEGNAKARLKALNQELATTVKNSNPKIDINSAGLNSKLLSMTSNLKQNGKAFSDLGGAGSDSFKRIEKSTEAVNSKIGGVIKSIIALGSILSTTLAVSSFNRVADDLTKVQSRLKLVIKDSDTLILRQKQLYQIARVTGSALGETAGLYVDFTKALEKRGVSQEKILAAISTIQKGGVLSGSSREALRGGLIQLTQGIASGTIRGEELNSVLEQMKFLSVGLQETLGMSTGQLRKFAEEGKLTTEVFLDVISKLEKSTAADFANTAITAEKGMLSLRSATSLFFGELNQRLGISQSFAKNLEKIANVIETVNDNLVASEIIIFQGLKNYGNRLRKEVEEGVSITPTIDLNFDFFDNDKVRREATLIGKIAKAAIEAGLPQKLVIFKKEGIDTSLLPFVKNFGENFVEILMTVFDSARVIFERFTKFVPVVLTPVVKLTSSIFYDIGQSFVRLSANIFETTIPAIRALENFTEAMVGNLGADQRLARAFVDIFRAASVEEFVSRMKEANAIARTLRKNDINFVTREIFRMTEGARKWLDETLISLGLMDQVLFKIKDSRLDRVVKEFQLLRDISSRLYQDLLAPKIAPIAFAVTRGVKIAVETFEAGLLAILNPQTGEALGTAFGQGLISGIKYAVNQISELFASIFSGKSTKIDFLPENLGKRVGTVLLSILGFFKSFIKAFFTEIFRALPEGFQQVIDDLSLMFQKLFNSKKGLSSLFDFDTSKPEESLRKVSGVFSRVLSETSGPLSTALARVKKFADSTIGFFEEVYEKVVGHSYWPDTINGILSETPKLDRVIESVKSFGKKITTTFKEVLESSEGLNFSKLFDGLQKAISNLNILEIVSGLSAKLITGLAAVFALVFGGPQAKALGSFYAVTLFADIFDDASGKIADVAAGAISKIAQVIIPAIFDSIANSINIALETLPQVFGNLVGEISPVLQSFGSVIAAVTPLSNKLAVLIATIAALAGAYSFLKAAWAFPISEIIFGRGRSKNKPPMEGITDYLRAIFNTQTSGIIGTGLLDKIFANKKLGIAAGVAFSTALLDSISVFEAAAIGTPLLAFALLGKDGGARIARDTFFFIENLFLLIGKRIISIMGATAFAKKVGKSFSSAFSGFGKFKSTAASSTFAKSFADLFEAFKAGFFNLKKNATAYSRDNTISFLDAVSFASVAKGTTGPKIDFKSKFDAVRDALFALRATSTKTVGDVFADIATHFTAIKGSLGLLFLRFTASFKEAFGAITLLAVNFIRHLGLLFTTLQGKFALFLILFGLLSGVANAAGTAGDAVSEFGNIFKNLGSTLLPAIAILGAMHLAIKAFVIFQKARVTQVAALKVLLSSEDVSINSWRVIRFGIEEVAREAAAGTIKIYEFFKAFFVGKLLSQAWWATSIAGFKELFTSIGSLTLAIKAVGAAILAMGVKALVPVLLFVKSMLLVIVGIIAAVAAIGALGLWLFGPGETLINSLEIVYDKIRKIFGAVPKTQHERFAQLEEQLKAIDVGGVKIDFIPQLQKIDLKKLDPISFKILDDSAKTTKEALVALNEVIIKQGFVTDAQITEREKLEKAQRNLLLRMPLKDMENFQKVLEAFVAPVQKVDDSLYQLAKNMLGIGPVLSRETSSTLTNIEQAIAAVGDFPLVIIGAIAGGLLGGPAGALLGSTVGGFLQTVISMVRSFSQKVVAYLTPIFETVSSKLLKLYSESEKFINNTIDKFRSKPTDQFIALQNAAKDVSQDLAKYFSFLPDNVQGAVRGIFIQFAEAAKKREKLLQRGFGSQDKDFGDFQQKLDAVNAEMKTLEALYFSTARTMGAFAKEEHDIHILKDEMEKLAAAASSLLDLDLGAGAIKFFGDDAEVKKLNEYIDRVRTIDKLMERITDKGKRKELLIERVKIQNVAKDFNDEIIKRSKFEPFIELQAKIIGGDITVESLRKLRLSANDNHGAFDQLVNDLQKFQQELLELPSNVTSERLFGVLDNIGKIRAQIASKLPVKAFFEDLNQGLQKIGANQLTRTSYLLFSTKDLQTIGEGLKSIETTTNALEQLGKVNINDITSRQQQIAQLQQLQGLINSVNVTIKEATARTISNIVGNAKLSNAAKAINIAELTKQELSPEIAQSSVKLGKYSKLQETLANTAAKMESIKEQVFAGFEIDESQFSKLNAQYKGAQDSLAKLSESAKKADITMDGVVSALTETGFAVNMKNFSKLSASTRQELAAIGVELIRIKEKLSQPGLSEDSLTSFIERQTVLYKTARDKLVATLHNTGAGLTEAFGRIGLSETNKIVASSKQLIKTLVTDSSRIASSGREKLTELLGFDAEIFLKKSQLADASVLDDYLEKLDDIVSLERMAQRTVEDISTTYSSALEAINGFFKINLTDIDFSRFTAGMRGELLTLSRMFQRELLVINQTGATSSGKSIESFFDALFKVSRKGEYVTFFAEFENSMRNAVINGVKSSFDKLKNDSGFDLDLRSLFNVTGDARRESFQGFSQINAFEKATNLPGLSPDMLSVLNKVTTGSSLAEVLSEFRERFETEFSDLMKTATELNTDSTAKNTAAIENLTNVMQGKGPKAPNLTKNFNPSALQFASGDISGELLALPSILKRKQLQDLADKDRSLRTSAETLTKGTSVPFAPEVLNLASDSTLATIKTLSNKIIDLRNELDANLAKGLPTQKIQADIEAYTGALLRIPARLIASVTTIRELGRGFAETFHTNMVTSLSDVMKGKKGVVDALLDTLTNQIIDTFVKGLLQPLTGESGILNSTLQSLGQGIGSIFGTSQSKKSAAAGLKDSPFTGFTESITAAIDLSSEKQGGYFAKLGNVFIAGLGGLAGSLGNFFSSLMGMFGGGSGGSGTGSILLNGLFGILGAVGGFAGAGGGTSGSSTAAAAKVFENLFATGGLVRGPGTGTSDSILARLSNREFVVNAKSTQKFLPLLEKINSGSLRKFASGGLISGSLLATPSMTDANTLSNQSTQQFNLNVTGDISRQTRREILEMMPAIASGVNRHNRERGIRS